MEIPKILLLKIIQLFIDIYDTKEIGFRKWILGTLLLLSKEFSNDIVRKLYWKQRFDIRHHDHLEIYKKISSKTLGFINVQVEAYNCNYPITDILYQTVEELVMLGCCESVSLRLEMEKHEYNDRVCTRILNVMQISIKIGENRDDVLKELEDCTYRNLRDAKSYYLTQFKVKSFSLVNILLDIISSSKVIENVTFEISNFCPVSFKEITKLQKVKSLELISSDTYIVDRYDILPFIQLQGNLDRFRLDLNNREYLYAMYNSPMKINQATFFTNGFKNLKILSIFCQLPSKISSVLEMALIKYLNSESSKTLESFNTNFIFYSDDSPVVYPEISNKSIHTMQVNIYFLSRWQHRDNIVDLVLDYHKHKDLINCNNLTSVKSLDLQVNYDTQCKYIPSILKDIPQLEDFYIFYMDIKGSLNLVEICETIEHHSLKLVSFQHNGKLIGDEVQAISNLFNCHHKTLTAMKLINIPFPNEILPSIYNNTNITHLQLDRCVSDDLEFLCTMLSKNITIEHLYVQSRYFGNPFQHAFNVNRLSEIIIKNNTIKTLQFQDPKLHEHFSKLFDKKCIKQKMDITSKRLK
ncbi:hypothetical protein DLAC_07284 [Tieghemostelium lacteum]|uniref:Uncharacterized protein n=1 Tax=Tieghemostelium lacteum TaxID=361077 RepID=A0A151ZC72_TIELA|nr:hypothetical protein DLAC_07284 [Tieghemostelium lacteum]|eukprot:KYQ91525.1 hypothetical protein DLAC_07284 [Tieghemostelium lacteum]